MSPQASGRFATEAARLLPLTGDELDRFMNEANRFEAVEAEPLEEEESVEYDA